MKKLISMMVAIICATSVFAQVQSDIRTATLIHGDQTRIFYGASAFKNAYNAAAQEGDVIVLSPGYFDKSDNITKSITIYGAGYETDPVSGAEPTSISSLSIDNYKDYNEYGDQVILYPKVHIEGLHIEASLGRSLLVYDSNGGAVLENLTVRKCYINGIYFNWKCKNCKFSQCVINGQIGEKNTPNFLSPQEQLNFENCWINQYVGGSLMGMITYDHCIIMSSGSFYAHFTNSIINCSLSENCTAYNNIFTATSIGSNVTGSDNWTNIPVESVFTNASQGYSYSPTNNFELRFPQRYVGTDGTEVGINGGVAPFNRISPVPRILSSDIDLRSTEDGKLNVSFQVEAQNKD